MGQEADQRQYVPGVDPEAVTTWLTERLPWLRQPLSFTRLAGGRSNVTVRVVDAVGRSIVIRRPPTVGVLPSAHDVEREYRVLDALRGTLVPVPRALALCADKTVTGAPFYAMEDVHGRVIRDRADAADLAATAREQLSSSLVSTLAELHSVDVTKGGLRSLHRPGNYLERQLRRLLAQFEKSRTRALPLAAEIHGRLLSRVPDAQRLAVVHGDYRLDNVMVGDDGRVQAVLDWELCTIGDPLADLAMLVIYWLEPGDDPIPTLSSPTDIPGFARRDQLVSQYAAATGLDVSDLPTYLSFAWWKLAIILEGVYSRYLEGAYSDSVGGYQQLGDAVPNLLERAAVSLQAA